MELDDHISRMRESLDRQISQTRLKISASFDGNSVTPVSGTLESTDYKFCPECGTRVSADAAFCPECGTRLEVFDEEGNVQKAVADSELTSDRRRGIIFTDTKVLAGKYQCHEDEILAVLKDFSDKENGTGVDWSLLNVAEYHDKLGEGTWMDYSDLLQEFIEGNRIKPGPDLSLFIIGGNDVIPQPAEANPCGCGDEYQDTVYADFYYCFHGPLPLDFLDVNKARCNVARLPLEMGKLETKFDDDITAYLTRSHDAAAEGNISIGNTVMTSNSDWIPASREMSRNLPSPHLENCENEVMDNMYLSPMVLADMDSDGDLSKKYYKSIGSADMLVFNLHGDCTPKNSGFYSSGLAFSIDMLGHSSAKIFNTVACWGGRYIKYRREHSMLLNAIYNNGVLLYSGSCVPALGKCGNFRYDGSWRIQPAAYSESFMARFCEYECLGVVPAGEAFLRAKCDYYNTSRLVEDDEGTLGTVLMFNLYGNPQLRTKTDDDALEEIQSNDGSKDLQGFQSKGVRKPFRKLKREVVMKGVAMKETSADGKSIAEDIRFAVDSNLRTIHEVVTRDLYANLGLDPRELYSVEKYTTENMDGLSEEGYLYNYVKAHGPITSQIRVKVDGKGRVLDAIETK